MTVLLLLPLLLIQRCNKLDLYLHSKLFTDKTQMKQEEQAYTEGARCYHGMYGQIYIFCVLYRTYFQYMGNYIYWNIPPLMHAKC